jgi:acyl-CoA synthetase (AMP-forming)/AMP-acid ligase II
VIGPFAERDVAAFLARAIDVNREPLVERSFTDLAARWRELGLRPGDLVLLALPTSVALLQHFFGVLAAGGVPALVAPGAPSARMREMAARMGARVVGAVRLPAGHLRGEGEEPPRVENVGAIETAWLSDGAPATSEGEVVLLTSGTSGVSSGCVTSVEAMLRNAERHAGSIGQRAEDTVLVSLPLYFSFALVAQVLGTLSRGGTLVIGGPPFHHGAYARTLAEHRVAVSALTPIQARTLLQHRTELPASLRVLGVGGDSLAPDHVAALLAARPGGELYLTYGLTQAGPRVSTLAAHEAPPHRYGSVGLPLPGTRVALADLGDGSGRKELLVSSDTLMRRRIGLVEGRSSADFREPGVLATGDVFDQDDEGYLYYRGRLSSYILRAGEKVSLATVQRLATALPGVVSARTKVFPGEEGEDFDLTLVVADTDARQTPEQYRAALSRIVRRGELPRAIEVVVDHPANASGYK